MIEEGEIQLASSNKDFLGRSDSLETCAYDGLVSLEVAQLLDAGWYRQLEYEVLADV